MSIYKDIVAGFLDGVFKDEHDRHPKGVSLRKLPGSVHTPFITDGRTIYV